MYWRSEKKQDEDTDVCVAGEGGTVRMIYAGQLTCIGVQRVVLSMESTLSFLRSECGATWSLREAESTLVGRGLNFCIYPSLECSSVGERPIGKLDQQLPPVPVITGSRGWVPLYGSSTARQ